ncbi:DUF4307 domain-containing protein [Nesterenkonia aerolata]|uniref:DUF4307 domain-containing protein n=1 Tax=Nesterenkonia aerolata TaxID=3074079 RepID=A0ABU2DQS8_9MICC|nr:DUF4307 domain-containing protein [Nesterenkonia sp. LY-0111]MDR8018841.1 DUF4307 domain-containing protein [Nesterenkonia sp. LY-0111]
MTDTPTQDTLAARYGTTGSGPSPRTRRWLIIGALLAAVLVTVYFAIGNAAGQLTYKDVGYTIHSDTEMTVDYEVAKDLDVTAQCMIHALDSSYAVVGATTVTIGPEDEGSGAADRSRYYQTDLRTEYRAVTGIVDQCWEVEG